VQILTVANDLRGGKMKEINNIATPKSNEESSADSQDILKKVAEVRSKIQSTFGQVVLAMSAVARYRHMMLGDLQQLVIDPLIKDKIVIAMPAAPDKDLAAAAAPATIAVWASLSDDADQRVREQIKAGVFPVWLRAEDWVSSDHVWLLDVIAPSKAMATEVLKSFKQMAKKGEVIIHPVVKRQIEKSVLEEFTAANTRRSKLKGADIEIHEFPGVLST
jgi:cytolysin-activating lysine-acyltransferase